MDVLVDTGLYGKIKYIDGITIIDTNGTILFTVKFNPKFYSEVHEREEVVGKNLFTSFPSLDENTSSLFKVLRTGSPVFTDEKEIIDFKGRKFKTTNISIPIKANGKIIGAIDLSREIPVKKDEPGDMIKLDPNIFKANRQLIDNIQPERAKYTLEDIITTNHQMIALKDMAQKISQGTSSVFIYGETGTGKELFAHALHNASQRAAKPFIAQNCAAIPESLFESILFGTVKGSFTGAQDNPGLFELADGGTLFLDEINSMPIHLQSKLLRVLQDGYIRRLGDKRAKKVDVRIITASNKRPEECVKDGDIRIDLFYRLCVMSLNIPPLRERKDDIQTLLEFFINKYNRYLKKYVRSVSREVFDILVRYYWPGNVRELEHVVESTMNQMDYWEDSIEIKHIDQRLNGLLEQKEVQKEIEPLKKAVANLEKKLITEAITKTKGNVSQAAKLLEIPRQTLQNKINSYNIVPKT